MKSKNLPMKSLDRKKRMGKDLKDLSESVNLRLSQKKRLYLRETLNLKERGRPPLKSSQLKFLHLLLLKEEEMLRVLNPNQKLATKKAGTIQL